MYIGFSMSEGAQKAYDRGLRPASKVGHGIPAELVRKFVPREEWHHCSSRYNRVDFYCPEKVLATFGKVASDRYLPDPDAVQALSEHNLSRLPERHYNATVRWIEWTGTRSHPKPKYMVAEGCEVLVKGNTAKVTLPSGETFSKRMFTNGFIIS